MKTLTIFTPAYNRAHTISRTYQRLCWQTLKDINGFSGDGKTNNTPKLVISLQNTIGDKYGQSL